jgi:hypothetical protein
MRLRWRRRAQQQRQGNARARQSSGARARRLLLLHHAAASSSPHLAIALPSGAVPGAAAARHALVGRLARAAALLRLLSAALRRRAQLEPHLHWLVARPGAPQAPAQRPAHRRRAQDAQWQAVGDAARRVGLWQQDCRTAGERSAARRARRGRARARASTGGTARHARGGIAQGPTARSSMRAACGNERATSRQRAPWGGRARRRRSQGSVRLGLPCASSALASLRAGGLRLGLCRARRRRSRRSSH